MSRTAVTYSGLVSLALGRTGRRPDHPPNRTGGTMKKTLTVMTMVIALALSMMSGIAAASSHLFPAQNEGACEDAGGTFTQVGSLRTCEVVGDPATTPETLREAGRSGRSWDSEVTRQTTTTYTRDGSDLDTVSSSTVVTSCTNPGGQVVTGGHCPTA
jgi:hypothetical protein